MNSSISNLWASPKINSRVISSYKHPAIKAKALNRGTTAIGNFSALLVVVFGLMFILHLFLINNAANKGFVMKNLQSSILQNTEKHKQLLVQQSMLTSSVTLADYQSQALVPVTTIERLTNNQFSSR